MAIASTGWDWNAWTPNQAVAISPDQPMCRGLHRRDGQDPPEMLGMPFTLLSGSIPRIVTWCGGLEPSRAQYGQFLDHCEPCVVPGIDDREMTCALQLNKVYFVTSRHGVGSVTTAVTHGHDGVGTAVDQ